MYVVAAVSESGGQRLESEPAFFAVKPYSPESIPRPVEVSVLRAIAANSGGAYFDSAEELDRALLSVTPKRIEQSVFEYKTYWQHWAILGILITLIALEWILRKFQNLT